MASNDSENDFDKENNIRSKTVDLSALFEIGNPFSRHLLKTIVFFCELDLKGAGKALGLAPENMAASILTEFKQWRSFIMFLATYLDKIRELESFRILSGWALIAVAYVEYHIPDDLTESQGRIWLDQCYDTVFKILYATACQHGTSNLKFFLSVNGENFFDKIITLIAVDDRFHSTEGITRYFNAVQKVLSHVNSRPSSTMSNSYNVNNEESQVSQNVYSFLRSYLCYILPRIILNADLCGISRAFVDHVSSVFRTRQIDLVRDYFPYILDYLLRKELPLVLLDHALFTLQTQGPNYFFSHTGLSVSLVAAFNRSTNPTNAQNVLRNIYPNTGPIVELERKFLGVLLHTRHSVVSEEYFVLRKQDIAASFSLVLNDISSEVLKRFSQKIFQTLWLMSSKIENFKKSWLVMFAKLEVVDLVEMGFKVLFYISQLDCFDELATAFLNRINGPMHRISTDKSVAFVTSYFRATYKRQYEAVTFVLWYCYGVGEMKELAQNQILEYSIMALSSSPHLTYCLLPKLIKDSGVLRDGLYKQIEWIDNLLPLVSGLKGVEEIAAVGACIGKIGAVSPVYVNDIRPRTKILDDANIGIQMFGQPQQFLNSFLKKLFLLYTDNDSSAQSDAMAYCLQCIAKEFVRLPLDMKKLPKESLLRELKPFTESTLVYDVGPLIEDMPLITKVKSHEEWAVAWFRCLNRFVKSQPFCLFGCLKAPISGQKMNMFAELLPLLIWICLMEMNPQDIRYYIKEEMLAVFASVDVRSDVRESCQVIFAFFREASNYMSSHRDSIPASKVKAYTYFEHEVMSSRKGTQRIPLSIYGAIACENYYTALHLLEFYVIEKDESGIPVFDRELFSIVQKMYASIGDVDNAQGAYLHILTSAEPSNLESVINAEISGDISEMLPMIGQSAENLDLVCRCILRLNQPEVAMAYIKENFTNLELSELREKYPDSYAIYSICAMQLGRWDLIAEDVEEVRRLSEWDPFEGSSALTSPTEQTFESNIASILSNCRNGEFERARQYFHLAQSSSTIALSKADIEDGRPYTVGFKYVQQLHSLADVEIAWPQLNFCSYNPEINTIDELMKKWEERDDKMTPTFRDLEPILLVRRNILRSLSSDSVEVKTGLTKLLVKSCKLARSEGLQSLVLPFITEAKSTGIKMIELEEERAMYYAETKDEQKILFAFPIISHAVASFFPQCSAILQEHIDFLQLNSNSQKNAEVAVRQPVKTLNDIKNEDTEHFIESMTLLTTIAQKQRDSCLPKVGMIFEGLEKMKANTQLFFYKYATFVDSTCGTVSDVDGMLLLKLCIETLKRGDKYLHELMPRLVTVWLDCLSTGRVEVLPESVDLISKALIELPKRYFYSVLSLLVSRLAKFFARSERKMVYAMIKKIVASIIAEYPHQGVLLSICEYRAPSANSDRTKAMTEVYAMATKMNEAVKPVVDAYKYMTTRLMQLAEEKAERELSLKMKYADLLKYFNPEEANPGRGKKTPHRRIPIPFFFAHLDEPFGVVPPEAIVILSADPLVAVLSSLERPKKMRIRCDNGQSYDVLVKPQDELRKDAAFMELARMLNARSGQNKHMRNIGANIRTFRVIPLQDKGGIIEWIPNMKTLTECVKGECTNKMAAEDLIGRLRKFNGANDSRAVSLYKDLRRLFKFGMAEYLRSMSESTASYYRIQRRYTSTTAVMCTIGFIVGLGDRHVGNILMDQKSGDVMHVDFCQLFNSAEKLPVPERVPFRLTRNIVDGFGAVGIEGRFRFTMERSLAFIQKEKTAVITCLKGSLNDPLMEWKSKMETVNENSVRLRIQMVESRLMGYNHSFLIEKCGPFSVRSLVSKLIEMSTDEKLLSRMYTEIVRQIKAAKSGGNGTQLITNARLSEWAEKLRRESSFGVSLFISSYDTVPFSVGYFLTTKMYYFWPTEQIKSAQPALIARDQCSDASSLKSDESVSSVKRISRAMGKLRPTRVIRVLRKKSSHLVL